MVPFSLRKVLSAWVGRLVYKHKKGHVGLTMYGVILHDDVIWHNPCRSWVVASEKHKMHTVCLDGDDQSSRVRPVDEWVFSDRTINEKDVWSLDNNFLEMNKRKDSPKAGGCEENRTTMQLLPTKPTTLSPGSWIHTCFQFPPNFKFSQEQWGPLWDAQREKWMWNPQEKKKKRKEVKPEPWWFIGQILYPEVFLMHGNET